MHDNLDQRLRQCFQTVFPGMPVGEIPLATTDGVSDWDSVAAVTLAAVVEEEFQISLDFERLPELNSYAALRSHLEQAT